MKNTNFTWAFVALCGAAVAAACSNSDDDNKPSVNLSGGTANVAGKGSGGSVSGGTNSGGTGATPTSSATTTTTMTVSNAGAAAVGGTGNAAGSTGTGVAGAVGIAGSTGVAGSTGTGDCFDSAKKCYTCADSAKQLLNHCTSATCIAFDNKTLSKLNADGSLPPLP